MRRRKLLLFVTLSLVGAATAGGQCYAQQVSAIGNISLAGQADGKEFFGDSAPLNSPLLIPTPVNGGQILQFSATGQIASSDFPTYGAPLPPEGDLGHAGEAGGGFGLSAIVGPEGALIGVFLGPGIPLTSARPPNLDFRGAARDVPTLNPLIQQVFYVGNGKLSSGANRNVVVPAGATRLFLAVMESYPTRNNTGSFRVTISGLSVSSAPTISSISPPDVIVQIPTTLKVNGSGFQNGFSAEVITPAGTFQITDTNARRFRGESQVEVDVLMSGTPTPPYTATLKIINPDGQSAAVTFQIIGTGSPAPLITSISPAQVTLGVPTPLTVNGSNFHQNLRAEVSTPSGIFPITEALTVLSSSQVQMRVTMAGTTGYSATLRIINPDGQSASVTLVVGGSSRNEPQPVTATQISSRALPTIVLTHGLQNLNDLNRINEKLWTGFREKQAGALIREFLNARRIDANMVQFVWEGAFQPFTPNSPISLACDLTNPQASIPHLPTDIAYINARRHVEDAGIRLGNALAAALGDSYDKKVHFIGHSLGTVVNAHALRTLVHLLPNLKEAQFTTLDFPYDIGRILCMNRREEDDYDYDPDFFVATLPYDNPNLRLTVDNYFSKSGLWSAGVGETMPSATTNRELQEPNNVGGRIFPDENGLLGFDNNHSGVQQWYRWTVNPVEPVPNGASVCAGESFTGSGRLHDTLNPCKEGWHSSIIHNSNGISPSSDAGGVRFQALDLTFNEVQNQGCSHQALGLITRITCSEASSPSLSANVEIGDHAEYLSFKYRFDGTTDGDYATVSLDDSTIWMLKGTGPTGSPEAWLRGCKPGAVLQG